MVPSFLARSGLFTTCPRLHTLLLVGTQWNEAHMEEHPRKLGLLAGTFEDLSIYVVPDPEDVRSKDDDLTHPTSGEWLALIYQHTTEIG